MGWVRTAVGLLTARQRNGAVVAPEQDDAVAKVTHDDAVAKATHGALSRQVPLVYLILCVNCLLAGSINVDHAPTALAAGVPVLVVLFFSYRGWVWYRQRRQVISATDAGRKLRTALLLTMLQSMFLNVWSFALLQYGGPEQQAQTLFFTGMTCAACMVSVSQLRTAVYWMAATTAVMFTAAAILHPTGGPREMAFFLLVAMAGLVAVLGRHQDSFGEHVEDRLRAERDRARTQVLAEENSRLANSDSLTGLPNRRQFSTEFAAALAAANRGDSSLALLLMDFNGFKAINDLYGHAAGDSLLIKASSRLSQAMTPKSFCARLGGDEFAVAVVGLDDEAAIADFGRHLAAVLSKPYLMPHCELVVTASIGVALFGQGAQTEREIFDAADYALYQAKDTATCEPVFFNETHSYAMRMLHNVDQNLRSGALDAEIYLVYQPVVQAGSLQLVGYEALARWHSPQLGEVSPAVFVAAAGKAGLTEKLTRLLFRKLLSDMSQIDPDVKVSFNLTSHDLINPQTLLGLVRDIQISGISPRRLQFELSEQAVHIDFDRVAKALTLLRNMGCAVCLDNFGSGQSTLSYAYRLPVSAIKIGGAFISECASHAGARHTLEAIVSLCDRLDIEAVAVGVENREQAALASEAGCMLLQGFHIAKPQRLAELINASTAATAASA